jgi:hypothetical protein
MADALRHSKIECRVANLKSLTFLLKPSQMIKKELKILLSKNKTQKVIDKLLSYIEIVNDNDDLYNEVILLSSRYARYAEEKRKGVLTFEQGQVEINNVHAALLNIIDQLPDTLREVNPYKPVRKEDSVVELIIDEAMANFGSNRKQSLITAISLMLEVDAQEIIIRKISSGSVKVAVELPKQKGRELVTMLKSGMQTAAMIGAFVFIGAKLKGVWLGSLFINLPKLIGLGIPGAVVAGLATGLVVQNMNRLEIYSGSTPVYNSIGEALRERDSTLTVHGTVIGDGKNLADSLLIMSNSTSLTSVPINKSGRFEFKISKFKYSTTVFVVNPPKLHYVYVLKLIRYDNDTVRIAYSRPGEVPLTIFTIRNENSIDLGGVHF